MLRDMTKRLRDRTVITTAILSLVGGQAHAIDNSAISQQSRV
jgi:hypothetical protein